MRIMIVFSGERLPSSSLVVNSEQLRLLVVLAQADPWVVCITGLSGSTRVT